MTSMIETTNGSAASVPIYGELGDTGLKRSWGLVQEEFLPQLQWDKANQVYREMGDNDTIVGSVLYALENLIRQVAWTVNGPEAAFVEDNMAAMSQTFEQFIVECISKLQYGWAYHEIVYQNVDGRVFWKKFPIRSQDTLFRWEFDENGGVDGMWQWVPWWTGNAQMGAAYRFIPIEKALLFRTSTRKNNPQGRSILRTAYRAWWFKKRIEDLEAIGVERDLAGIPRVRIPASVLALGAGNANYDAYKNIGVNLRQDEQVCVMLPSDRDEAGNLLYDIDLMASAGSKQMNTDTILSRYSSHIAMAAMADVILMGHERVGSYSLANTKEGLLTSALQSQIDEIAAVLNNYALPRLFALNGIDGQDTEFVPGQLQATNAGELADTLFKLSQSGWMMFPDPELEEYLRGLLDLPEPSAETMAMATGSVANPAPAGPSPESDIEQGDAGQMIEPTEKTDTIAALLALAKAAQPVNVNVGGGGLKIVRDDNGLLTGIEAS